MSTHNWGNAKVLLIMEHYTNSCYYILKKPHWKMLIDHVQLLTNVWTASGSDSKTEEGTWKKRIPNSLEYHITTNIYPSEVNTDSTSSFSV